MPRAWRLATRECVTVFAHRIPLMGSWRARDSVPAMTKWEYATVPLLTHATKQILDQWGSDGWELVTVMPGPTGEQLVAYLKRPKQ
jgi:hypothetical protein